MVQGDPQLDALNHAALAPLVQRALDRERAEPVDWRWEPVDYHIYLPERTLVRFSGTAVVDDEVVPWSMVLKRTRPPQANRSADDGWRHEALAYRSGLLADLPHGLTTPRVFDVVEDADGATWLWLEDVADCFGGMWPLAQYRRTARHLGRFNGTYLGARPLPTFPWLAPRWADHQGEPARIPAALPEIADLVRDGRVQRAFPLPITDCATRLLRDVPTFIALLDRLPQTLCHHDASQANLIARRRAGAAIETVAIDWESIGHGTVGADIATLVFGTMRRGTVLAEWAADLDQEVFAGYLAGLRDAGWQGEPAVARLGYTATVALRGSLLTWTLRALTDDAALARIASAVQEPAERAARRFVLMSLYLLACADEARTLARQYEPTPGPVGEHPSW